MGTFTAKSLDGIVVSEGNIEIRNSWTDSVLVSETASQTENGPIKSEVTYSYFENGSLKSSVEREGRFITLHGWHEFGVTRWMPESKDFLLSGMNTERIIYSMLGNILVLESYQYTPSGNGEVLVIFKANLMRKKAFERFKLLEVVENRALEN